MSYTITNSHKYPATLYLPGDSINIEKYQLMGRRVAGKEFALGIIKNLTQGEELNILVKSENEKEYLNKILLPYLPSKSSLNIITGIEKLNLDELDNIHIPDPCIEKWSAIRTNSNHNKFSITGIIHTLCSNAVIDGFKDYIFGGLESWDALVCTSTSGKDVVEKTIDFYRKSFERKYNVTISKQNLPQLYTIPLAVNDITCNKSLTRKEKRLNSRKKLGISQEAIVILYLGRLSFHAKSHPLTLYKALSKISFNNHNKEIILLECGTFANKLTEEYYNNFIFLFKNITVKRVGGINQASEQAKIDCLNAANIFISLSDNIQETFGLTVIEAMAAELPTIVSDWNGYKDLVKDNETGYLIPTKYASSSDKGLDNVDIEYKFGKINFDYMIGLKSMKTVIDENVLIKKLNHLINNNEIRENMGSKSKQRWNKLFNWKVVSKQYRELWSDLKERRESYEGKNYIGCFHPSIDYIFKEYSTETYNKEKLFVDNDSINPEILLYPIHSPMIETITSKKTSKIIELINSNKSISSKDLKMIGIQETKAQEIMALIEKLGIAKNKSREV